MQTITLAPIRTVHLRSLITGVEVEHRSEPDSHVDTSVVGDGTALVTMDHNSPVQVYGHDGMAGGQGLCRTVSSVVAYDHPSTGQAYMLEVHQVILVPPMKDNLLSTMQMRDNDVKCNDKPKHMVLNPTDDHNAITLPCSQDDTTPVEPLRILLTFHRVTSFFLTWKPTKSEYKSMPLCYHYNMTAESHEWDPHTTCFKEQEEAMLDRNGLLREVSNKWWSDRSIAAVYAFGDDCQPEFHLGWVLEGTSCVTLPVPSKRSAVKAIASKKQ